MGTRPRFRLNPIWITILVMLFVSLLIVMGITFGLDIYTRHGKQVRVPDVMGNTLEEAAKVLTAQGLQYEIIDSVYIQDAKPGTVREIVPAVGSTVKPHRLVFLSVYATHPPKVILPSVVDLSRQQAERQLLSLGFERVKLSFIPGEFDDLTLRVTDERGIEIPPGTRVEKNTPLVLVISKADESLSPVVNMDAIPTLSSGELPEVAVIPDTTERQKPKPKEQLESNEQWW